MFKKFLEKKRREKRIKDDEEILEEKKVNKTYIMSRLEDEKSMDILSKQFEDANEYFVKDKNMIIGN